MSTDTLPLNPLAEGLDTVRRAPPGVLVVFGASGDLTHRKLLARPGDGSPAGVFFPLPSPSSAWPGHDMSDDGFRDLMAEAVPHAGPGWAEIIKNSAYVSGDYSRPRDVQQAEGSARGNRRGPGDGFQPDLLPGHGARRVRRGGPGAREGRSQPVRSRGGFARLVIEKPFGRDLDTARQLDAALHDVFDEDQIYRIDHYLGKETVQNVLALRFANAIFEPLWSRNYIDHVQITVAETIGVEKRGNFYEKAGALRDIVQNHVMQVLSLTLMEPPGTIDAEGIRDEKVKALRSVVVPQVDEVANIVGPGPVRQRLGRGPCRPRLPPGGGGEPEQPDRDLRGAEAPGRQLALGRRSDLYRAPESGSPSG